MLNQERIILMTKLASYEENMGKKNGSIMGYFRGDYIWLQIVKSIVCGTLAFGIVFAMYIFYDFEVFMTEIYKMDLRAFGKSVLTKYLVAIGIYSIISYAVYSCRYARAKRSMELYKSNLGRLSGMYDKT
ncbi:MAG: hypothetical protein MR430_01455 [Lachnospiraceae bacterium]|nr:hypothetical protein [Lachnospiraceae bacterium]